MAVDYIADNGNAQAFLASGGITMAAGGVLALSCANGTGQGLSLQHAFLLTTGVWVVVPVFGAVPLMLGAPGLGVTDAIFESVSGLTTTGTTIIGPKDGRPGLDSLPPGANLWRGMLQWFGGLGILIVAMIFLPVMKVGGMQYFRTEGFDTLGKVLPRAGAISGALIQIYVALTLACMAVFSALGLGAFDAVMHGLTTVSTGGFSSYDRSFGPFQGAPEYAASLFMILAALPFIRYVQMMQGHFSPIARDAQVRAFLRWIGYAVGMVTAYLVFVLGTPVEPALREALFNIVSTVTGAGFASVDVTQWGAFPFTVLIVVGLIGGCTSSTVCSVKVFRYLILLEAVRVQLRRLHSPSAVFQLRYEGRHVDEDVLNSVIVFFTLFILSFGALMVALSLTGLGTRAAFTGAWTAIANIGPVFGPEVGPSGAVDGFPRSAKWLMIFGMLLGRLELLSVYVLLLPRFWRA